MRSVLATVALGTWLVARPSVASPADSSAVLTCAIHVHSTISTGSLEPAAIMRLADDAGVDAVMFTDSAQRHWEYGLWPLRGVLKWVVEQPSVSTCGPRRYVEMIRSLNVPGRHALAIPGVEVAPFYYWKRGPFDRQGGSIQDWQQHLLVWLDDPEAIRQIPLQAFDPYHGEQGAVPYQRVIDFIAQHGGLVWWAHPHTGHLGRHAFVEDYTEPYLHLLERTTGYQGFALTYLGYLEGVEPGAVWDRLLRAYCRGAFPQPVWVIGELDWRGPQERPLNTVVTQIRVRERTPQGGFEAMRQVPLLRLHALRGRL